MRANVSHEGSEARRARAPEAAPLALSIVLAALVVRIMLKSAWRGFGRVRFIVGGRMENTSSESSRPRRAQAGWLAIALAACGADPSPPVEHPPASGRSTAAASEGPDAIPREATAIAPPIAVRLREGVFVPAVLGAHGQRIALPISPPNEVPARHDRFRADVYEIDLPPGEYTVVTHYDPMTCAGLGIRIGGDGRFDEKARDDALTARGWFPVGRLARELRNGFGWWRCPVSSPHRIDFHHHFVVDHLGIQWFAITADYAYLDDCREYDIAIFRGAHHCEASDDPETLGE